MVEKNHLEIRHLIKTLKIKKMMTKLIKKEQV